MGTERVDGLPDELESWVDDRAAATDLTREEVVRRLIAAHRELEENGEPSDGIGPAGDDEPGVATDAASVTDVESIERRLDDVDGRVADLEADVDEKITDVRERVIQVKRETDAKAPADHDHPTIERRLSAGFENYEEILEYLTESSDEHGSKLDRLGSAVVALRSRLSALEREADEREAVADLRREANRHGVTKATCESCGETVRLGLLDDPHCPHCDSPFDGLDPKRGFFGASKLTVGDRPALESAEDPSSPAADGTRATRDLTDDPTGPGGAASDAGGKGEVADEASSAPGTPSSDSKEVSSGPEEVSSGPEEVSSGPEERSAHPDGESTDSAGKTETVNGSDVSGEDAGGTPRGDHEEVQQ